MSTRHECFTAVFDVVAAMLLAHFSSSNIHFSRRMVVPLFSEILLEGIGPCRSLMNGPTVIAHTVQTMVRRVPIVHIPWCSTSTLYRLMIYMGLHFLIRCIGNVFGCLVVFLAVGAASRFRQI